MDEELKAYLEAMETRIVTGLMTLINDNTERLLDGMQAMRQDVDSVRGHVLFGLQENLTLSQRITKLEEEIRKR